VAPTLPLGANLSLPGIARLAAEFLDRLNMDEVTLAGNDTGGALAQLLMAEDAARVAGWCSSPATRSATSRPG